MRDDAPPVASALCQVCGTPVDLPAESAAAMTPGALAMHLGCARARHEAFYRRLRAAQGGPPCSEATTPPSPTPPTRSAG